MSRKNRHQHESETMHDEDREGGRAGDEVAEARSAPEAAAAADLSMIDDLERQIAEIEGRYKRALADYQNYQRRSVENERRAFESGRVGVVEALVPLLEHFRMALQMDPAKTNSEQVLGGVRAILAEFERVLSGFGVQSIDPKPNDEFDPNRHEAMLRSAGEGIEPGRIVATLQAGYAMGDRVIRPAKVSVSPSSDDGSESGAGEGDGD